MYQRRKKETKAKSWTQSEQSAAPKGVFLVAITIAIIPLYRVDSMNFNRPTREWAKGVNESMNVVS